MSLGLYSLGYPSLGLMYGAPRTAYGFLLFTFEPDWSEKVKEIFTWRTNVIEAHDGKDQRIGLRAMPRRQFNYSVALEGLRAFQLESILYAGTQYEYAMPVWTDGAPLTSPASNTDDSIYINHSSLGFWQGGYVVIYQSETLFEFARVQSLEPGKLVLTETPFYDWPAGTLVYPVIFVTLEPSSKIEWFRGDALTGNLTLTQVALNSNSHLPLSAAPVTYLEKEVITARPNWVGDMGTEINSMPDILDVNVGVVSRYFFKKHGKVTRGFKYLLNGRDEINDFRAFLQRTKGRLKTFYVPRAVHDLTLVLSISALGVNFTFSGQHYALYVGLNKGRDHLCIKLLNGVQFYRRVVNVSISSGSTVVEVDNALGVAVPLESVAQVSFLTESAMAADQVTIEWFTNEIAECETYFESVIT